MIDLPFPPPFTLRRVHFISHLKFLIPSIYSLARTMYFCNNFIRLLLSFTSILRRPVPHLWQDTRLRGIL